jgi:hypothetical protein
MYTTLENVTIRRQYVHSDVYQIYFLLQNAAKDLRPMHRVYDFSVLYHIGNMKDFACIMSELQEKRRIVAGGLRAVWRNGNAGLATARDFGRTACFKVDG